MFAVNLVIIVESIRSIASHKGDDTNKLFIPAIAAVASALGWLPTTPPPVYGPVANLRTNRRQVPAIPVLSCRQERLEPSTNALGGPQERLVRQRVW